MEEAAYMDLGVFYEVIVPLVEVKGTALIGISTPLGRWNFYSELTEAKDEDGVNLFNVIKVGMVCDRCRGTEKEADCQHPVPDRPAWKDEDAHETVKALYGSERMTYLRREIMGIVADDESMAFNADDLMSFFNRPSYTEPHAKIQKVWVAVDPNGGGKAQTGSETAVVSFFYDGPRVVICGLENYATKDQNQTWQLVYSHIQALRNSPCFSQSQISLVPEANLGNEAQFVGENAVRIVNVSVLSMATDYYGVYTDGRNKPGYVVRAAEKFAEKAVSYHEKIIVTNPLAVGWDAATKVRKAKAEFERQVRSFQQVFVMSEALRGRSYVEYTGKANSEQKRTSRQRDDMCMAFLIGLYHSGRFLLGLDQLIERGWNKRLLPVSDFEHETSKHVVFTDPQPSPASAEQSGLQSRLTSLLK